MFTVTACCQIEYDYASAKYGPLHMDTPTLFDAYTDDWNGVVKFPKWVNVKLKEMPDGKVRASFRVNLFPAKDNPKNETGIKRVLKFMELVGAVEYKKGYVNSYPSIQDALEAFEKLAA